MDTQTAIQWTIVALAVAGALIWLVVKVVKLRKIKNEGGGCCGCSIADSCKKKDLYTDRKKGSFKKGMSSNCGHHDGPTAMN